MHLTLTPLEPRLAPAAPVATLPVVPDLDPATAGHLRVVAAEGRARGLRSDVFAKFGDSITATPLALGPLGVPGPLPAGLTAADLATIDRFRAPVDAAGRNSFTRVSDAARPGWTLRNLDGAADRELAATRAGIAVIQIGTNDARVMDADEYRDRLGRLVDHLSAEGVVAVLSTVPPLTGAGPGTALKVDGFNQIVADVAFEKQVPLLNLARALLTLPGFGLDRDGVHLTGTRGAADRRFGQAERGFDTVQALTAVQDAVFAPDVSALAAAVPENFTPFAPGRPVLATGAGEGQPGVVTVTDPATGEVLARVLPFGPGFLGGVRAATGDITGDGVPDLVTAAGPGGGPAVRAYDGATGGDLGTVFAFEPGFRGGVTVAVGDADGDGRAEVAVGAGPGGGPRVRLLGPDLAPRLDFFAFDPAFTGGVSVALAPGLLAAGAGRGGAPVVATFDPTTGVPRAAAAVFDATLRTGLAVAAADLDGDGRPELVAGTGRGSAPVVRVLDAETFEGRGAFFAGDPAAFTGVRVAAVGGRIAVPGGLYTPAGERVRAFDSGPDAGFGGGT